MQKLTCTGCGTWHSLGYLFDNPAIRLCAQCKGVWLTFLLRAGFPMTDESWLTRELCENSHAVDRACWSWHDSTDLTHVRIVFRIRK